MAYGLCIALAAMIGWALSGGAFAGTLTPINCTASATALSTASFSAGSSYGVQGACQGPVTITADNVTFQNADASGDTITGSVTVQGAHNVVFQAVAGTLTFASGGGDGLYVTGGASVSLSGIAIENAADDGILVDQGSVVGATDLVVQGSGQGGDATDGSGIAVQDGATVVLATSESGATQIAQNLGNAVTAMTGNLIAGGADIAGANGLSAISATAGAHVRLSGGTIAADFAQPTILVAGSSSLWLSSVRVLVGQATPPAIQISTGSSLQSAGGNTICYAPDLSGSCAPSGFAVQIDHGSSFAETSGTPADSITGAGMVQEQSSMELGTGAATPSAWSGTITAQQNSSFRMSGGMSITGQLILDQGSNGFFNVNNGGIDGVSGGVTCPFSAIPASHVSGPTKITPPVTTGADLATIASPTCLAF